jgi:predicted CopG family antitoxin
MNSPPVDSDAQFMHDLCMATKTISLETDAYDLLKNEKRDERESFSQVVRRLFAERPVLTAGELLEAMKSFEGRGAGKRRTGRHAAA